MLVSLVLVKLNATCFLLLLCLMFSTFCLYVTCFSADDVRQTVSSSTSPSVMRRNKDALQSGTSSIGSLTGKIPPQRPPPPSPAALSKVWFHLIAYSSKKNAENFKNMQNEMLKLVCTYLQLWCACFEYVNNYSYVGVFFIPKRLLDLNIKGIFMLLYCNCYIYIMQGRKVFIVPRRCKPSCSGKMYSL